MRKKTYISLIVAGSGRSGFQPLNNSCINGSIGGGLDVSVSLRAIDEPETIVSTVSPNAVRRVHVSALLEILVEISDMGESKNPESF